MNNWVDRKAAKEAALEAQSWPFWKSFCEEIARAVASYEKRFMSRRHYEATFYRNSMDATTITVSLRAITVGDPNRERTAYIAFDKLRITASITDKTKSSRSLGSYLTIASHDDGTLYLDMDGKEVTFDQASQLFLEPVLFGPDQD